MTLPANRRTGWRVEEAWSSSPKAIDQEVDLNCSHIIKFQSLSHAGKSLVFPCDAQGHVPLDELSERARENYLYARAVVGREYAFPAVLPDIQH